MEKVTVQAIGDNQATVWDYHINVLLEYAMSDDVRRMLPPTIIDSRRITYTAMHMGVFFSR